MGGRTWLRPRYFNKNSARRTSRRRAGKKEVFQGGRRGLQKKGIPVQKATEIKVVLKKVEGGEGGSEEKGGGEVNQRILRAWAKLGDFQTRPWKARTKGGSIENRKSKILAAVSTRKAKETHAKGGKRKGIRAQEKYPQGGTDFFIN